jgi:hypothetical protein
VSNNALPAQSERWTGSEGGWKGVAGGNGALAGARKLVPKVVVNSFGSLFNDETYSDVEFWLPSRRRRNKKAQGEATAMEGVEQESGHEFATTNTTTITATQLTSPKILGTSPSNSLSNDGELLGDRPPAKKLAASPSESEATRPDADSAAPVISESTSHNPYYRKIWANKKILRRGDFFKDLLSGGFSEGNDPPVSLRARGISSYLTPLRLVTTRYSWAGFRLVWMGRFRH